MEIASGELYPCRNGGAAAEGGGRLGDSAHAGGAIGIAEITPALEEAGNGVLAGAGGGFEEVDGGGLGKEGVEERCESGLKAGGVLGGVVYTALVDYGEDVRSRV